MERVECPCYHSKEGCNYACPCHCPYMSGVCSKCYYGRPNSDEQVYLAMKYWDARNRQTEVATVK